MESETRDRFAQNLDRIMTETETTNQALADAVGVTKAMVSRWRNGHDVPATDRWDAIAEVLCIDVADFLAQ